MSGEWSPELKAKRGRHIRKALRLLAEMEFTIEEMAEYFDVGKSTIYRWERGESLPRGEHASLAEDLVKTEGRVARRQPTKSRVSEPKEVAKATNGELSVSLAIEELLPKMDTKSLAHLADRAVAEMAKRAVAEMAKQGVER